MISARLAGRLNSVISERYCYQRYVTLHRNTKSVFTKAGQLQGCFKSQHIQNRMSINQLGTQASAQAVTMKKMREEMLAMMSAQKAWLDSTDKRVIESGIPAKQSELPTRSMTDSILEGIIPLSSSNGKDRLKYLTPYDQVRFGRLLEDLDTFAVACCYKHNENPFLADGTFHVPRAIWTVLVDRIDLTSAFKDVANDRDIKLRGHVSWVGKSSMEATIDVTQPDASGQDIKLLEAVFVMVARNPLMNCSSLVHPLQASTADEQKILARSEELQGLRKKMAQESLLKTAPNEKERKRIHDIFINTLDPSATTFKIRVKPEGSCWMDESMLKTVRICFPEQKNLYNKIFGGFLMRQAYELAWANAAVYSKSRCVTWAVDDIVFSAPVSIGSFLYLSSQVCYTKGHKMQVRVHAEVRDPVTDQSYTSNEFHFTLEASDGKPVPRVLPKTYAESMIYLDSRRRFREAMEYRQKTQDNCN